MQEHISADAFIQSKFLEKCKEESGIIQNDREAADA